MRDRVPLHPGRIRLTPVGGDLYDLVRADEPLEPGTPLNKANLLSDETAALFRLQNENPTQPFFANVDNALRLMTSGLRKKLIDIRTTSGTWTCPQGVFEISALLVGGGSGGGFVGSVFWGGNSGVSLRIKSQRVIPGASEPITIGAGGATNTAGGNTSFLGSTAHGGFNESTFAVFGSTGASNTGIGGSWGNAAQSARVGSIGLRGSIGASPPTSGVIPIRAVSTNLTLLDNYDDLDFDNRFKRPLIAGGGGSPTGTTSGNGGEAHGGNGGNSWWGGTVATSGGGGGAGLLMNGGNGSSGASGVGGVGGGGGGGIASGAGFQFAAGGVGCVLIFAYTTLTYNQIIATKSGAELTHYNNLRNRGIIV